MKKYTPILLAGGIALLAFSYLSESKKAEYSPRNPELQSGQEPYSMEWARVDLRTGKFNPQAALEVRSAIHNRASRATSLGLDFVSRGPDNIGGRTRAILELYGKPDTLLAGSVTGGLYVSYNAGATWQPHAQFQNLDSSSSFIASIFQDTITKTIYVGTGSSFDDGGGHPTGSRPGYGIFISNDEGRTFTHLKSTVPDNRFSTAGSPWIAVNRIQCDGDGNIFAATHNGLKKSSDDGKTWEDVIFLDEANTFPITGNVADIVVMKNGFTLASMASGAIYRSSTGDKGTFERLEDGVIPTGGMGRTCLAVSPQNHDHMYVMCILPNSCLDAVYESLDGGDNWTKRLVDFDDFEMMNNGQYCQGVYDACIGVSPLDEDMIFMGGITIWRFDGNLTRIAFEGGGPPASDILPFYVHADKHYIYFSPNDKRRMYVCSDGGLTRTSDNGNTWQGINKGYNTTQFYGIAHANDGRIIIGGTQDNGTPIVLGDNEYDPNIGYTITGNDGIDCDMSQISGITISSSQNGLVFRSDAGQFNGQSIPTAVLSEMNSGGPFHTVVKLWENINDKTSRDSVVFKVETQEISLAVSNGVVRNYNEVVIPLQPAAIVDISSVVIHSSGDTLKVMSDNKTLDGDGTGTVSMNSDGSFNVNATFDNAPTENSNVYVRFEQRFEANAVLYLESDNLNSGLSRYTFEHRLEYNLNPGDSIRVQDPVQSMLCATGGGTQETPSNSLQIYRNVLNFQKTPVPIPLPTISASSVTCAVFTSDGDKLFVGTSGGAVYRVSGLQELYTSDDLANVTVNNLNLGQTTGGGVTGIAIDPNNDNRLVVTRGGFGQSGRVLFTNNALMSNPTFVNVHGDLPLFPVYDPEIDRNDPNIVLLGTEFGLWATSNIENGTSVEWSDENNDLMYVPIFDVRQQGLPWERAKNSGMYYVGSFGRGFWETGTLVGIKDVEPMAQGKDAFSGLKVYPNPMQHEGTIEFKASLTGMVTFSVYDIQGRVVKSWQERVVAGDNRTSFAAGTLRSGNYYATVESGQNKAIAKFIVLP